VYIIYKQKQKYKSFKQRILYLDVQDMVPCHQIVTWPMI